VDALTLGKVICIIVGAGPALDQGVRVPAKETTMSASPAMRDLLGADVPSKVINGTGAPVNPIAIR
jgi:hypothetical protein